MIVVPFESVGNLFFSDKREVIREKRFEKFSSGVKGDDSDVHKDYYDYFEESELFVYYDGDDIVNAFEFYQPIPVFNNLNLLKASYGDLVTIFLELDPNLSSNYNDFTSFKYGIGANTNDDPEDENAVPEAVIVFRKGYYDSLEPSTKMI